MKVFLESDKSAGDKPQPAVTVVFDSIDELSVAMGFKDAEMMWRFHRTISEAVILEFSRPSRRRY